MRFPLSTGMAKNGNFIPVIERNRALIPGPKGNNGNKGGEYFPQLAFNDKLCTRTTPSYEASGALRDLLWSCS